MFVATLMLVGIVTRISDVEIFELGASASEKSSPWSSTILVLRLTTSDGTVGYGEAPTTLMTRAVYEQLREMGRIFKGREVRETEQNRKEAYKHSFYLPVSMEATSALSAFEIASWDIIGKLDGKPLYDEFGGMVRDRIRAYANGWYDNCVTPEQFVAKAKRVVAQGFTGVKFDPFADAYDTIDDAHVEHAREVVGAVRSKFGKLDIMIECHGRFNAEAAIKAGRALEDFGVLFIEEPVHPDQFLGLLKFRQQVSIPVALGERVLEANGFLRYLSGKAVDVIQPDITNVGGMMQGKQAAELAESFGAKVAYHNAFGPIQSAATLNVDYTIPNLLIQESFEAFWPSWKRKLVRRGYRLDHGYFRLEKGRPGLGIEIDERLLEERKVSGQEPFNAKEPAWTVSGTFKPIGRGRGKKRGPRTRRRR